MSFFTAFLFIITGVVIYVWYKKEKISVLSDNGDLNKPLNPDISRKKIVISGPKMFHSFLKNEKVKRSTDTYLPEFLKDSIIEHTESSPVPDKLTNDGAPGFFVYKEQDNSSYNNFPTSEQVITTESVFSESAVLKQSEYYTPQSSLENVENMV
jgi:hypothetical protein